MLRYPFPAELVGALFLTAGLLLALTGCSATHSAVERDDSQRMIDSLQTANEDLLDSLQFYDDIYSGKYYRDRRVLTDRITRLEYDVLIARDGGRTVESFAVDDLFNPATASLTDSGREQIARLAEKLQEEYPDREIRVEGHSDSSPVGGSMQDRYPSNWELSAARAAAIVRELTETHGLDARRLGVVSFAETRPVLRETSSEARRMNRRIRVAVLP